MPILLDSAERAARLVDAQAIDLLSWCSEIFARTYGATGPIWAGDTRWKLPIGSEGDPAMLVTLVDEPDQDGNLGCFQFEAVTAAGRLCIAGLKWFPMVHIERAWVEFEALARELYFSGAVLALIRESTCRRCGSQEFVCHNEQLCVGGKPCCHRCSHPITIRSIA
jgi:hypothetical protein